MDQTRASRRCGSPQSASAEGSDSATLRCLESPDPRPAGERGRSVWFPWRCLDCQSGSRDNRADIWRQVSPHHVGRLMREAGWSRQQLIEQATQRNEEAIKD